MSRDDWKNLREDSSVKRTNRGLLEDMDFDVGKKIRPEASINANVVISSPSSFRDVQTLIDNLRRREPVIFNLESISKESAQRILDFMSGAAYALGGSMKRIKEFLFLVTPEGVSITVPVE